MENKNIIISDNVSVSDKVNEPNTTSKPPIRGVISIYDKDGNLVKRVNNMVVNGGRYLLYGLFLNYALYGNPKNAEDTGLLPTNTIAFSNSVNDYTVKSLTNSIFSINFSYTTDTIKTVSELNIDDVTNISSNNLSFELSTTDSNSGLTVDADPFDLKITFKSTIHGSTNFQKFNQIYLTYNLCNTDGTKISDNHAILFSRVIMDPVFIGADGEYSIHYSLFF